MPENGPIAFASSLDNADLVRSGEEAKNVFRNISRTAQEEGGKMDDTFKKFGAAIGGYFTFQAASSFAKQIVQVRGEIESLEVSFKTLLGDQQKAVKLMSEIRRFAASTPMQMQDLAAGAKQLLAFNIEAEKVMPLLQALGDVSMGDSAKFQGLTLAFAQMSSAGKLMGQDLMQMINAGFNPLAVISEKTGKSIGDLKEEMSNGKISVDMVTQAFMDATSEGGKFYGMLDKQSKGIKGSISNLQGAISDMMNELGEQIQEPVTGGIQALQRLVQNYQTIGKIVGTLIATFGTYKAAVMAVTAAETIATQVSKGYTIAQQLQYSWLLLVEKAQSLLNKTMLKNPYVLAATAIISLVTALALFRRRANEAEQSQQALNAAIEGSKKRESDLKNETDSLISTLDDETQTHTQHTKALERLKSLYPELLKDVRTYNEYLEHRQKLLKSMPEAQEEEENRTLKERVELFEKYTKIRNDYNYRSKGNGKVETYTEHESRIIETYGSQAEQNRQEQAIRKKLEKDYQEWKKQGNKGTLDEYVRLSLQAEKKILNERLEAQREAEWNAKPIEQKIEITQESIQQSKAAVTYLRQQAERQPWNIKLQFDLQQAESALQELEKKEADLQAAVMPKKTLSDITSEIMKGKRELEKARDEYRKNASEINKKAVEEAEASLDSSKKNYKNATGKDYDQAVKEAQDQNRRLRELNEAEKKEREKYAEWLKKQARQAAIDRRQSQIEGEKEGLARTLKQIELDYDQQMQAIDEKEEEMVERLRDMKEKEWEAANPVKPKKGETFDRSTVSSADLSPEQKQQIKDYVDIATEERSRKERKAFEASLADIKTYQQRRLDIIKEYQQKEEELYDHDQQGGRTNLRQGVSQGNVDELQKQRNEALESLDKEMAQRSDTYKSWCNQIAQWTYTQLVAALQTAQQELQQAQADFGEDSEEAAMLRQQIADITQRIQELRRQGDVTSIAALQGIKEILPSLSNVAASIDTAASQVESLGSEWAKTAAKSIRAISDIVSNSTTILQGILTLSQTTITAIQGTTTGATSAMTAAAESSATAIHIVESASVILAVISAALGIVQAIVNTVRSATEKRHEEKIKSITNEVDNLDDAYDNLEKQAQKTFGASNAALRQQQAELKKAQIELLNTAIAEENAAKNPDTEKIDQWKSQIKQLKNDIADLGEASENAIFGEDINTAIENFANALTEAWATGTSASINAKDTVRAQMKQMVQEAIKDTIQAGGQMAAIREKLKEFFSDQYFDPQETAQLEQMADNLQQQINEQFAWATDLFSDSGSRSAAGKGIQSITQDTAEELNGRITAIQGHTYSISQNTILIQQNVAAITDTVAAIRTATEASNSRLSAITSVLDEMQRNGVRIR